MSSGLPLHPYYPPDGHFPGYIPNEASVLKLYAIASIASTALLGTTYALVAWIRPSSSKADRAAVMWFVLSGSLHCFFEGYFMLNHHRMLSTQDIVGQLWKEYALSDSRYMTSDTLVLCMETVTVLLWGPLCFCTAYSILSKGSLRHPLQMTVCMAHLYGDTLYYATSLFDHYAHGRPYCRPEPYYFWVYYWFFNFIWIVIPLCYFTQSVRAISDAFKTLQGLSRQHKSR